MKKIAIGAAVEAALKKKIAGEAVTESETEMINNYEVQELKIMNDLLNEVLTIASYIEDDSESDTEVEAENAILKQDSENTTSVDSTTNINNILEQRGSRYGDFNDHAKLTQNLKNQLAKVGFYTNPKFKSIHKEAIDMILHKLARIVNGDPNYDDSWVDISGYATLVADHIKKL